MRPLWFSACQRSDSCVRPKIRKLQPEKGDVAQRRSAEAMALISAEVIALPEVEFDWEA